MKTRKEWSRKKVASKAIWMLAVAVFMLLNTQQAFASTAANTNITNTVTVTFNDTADNPQTPITAFTTVTVTLVAAAPTLNSPGNVDPALGNTLIPLTYVISSNANGPDTYTLSSVSVNNNLSAPAMALNPLVNPIPLGGTTLAVAAAISDTTITVPYDGTSDGVVNGIGADDWFVIGSDPVAYQVLSIVEDSAGNTATLTLYAVTPIANIAPVGTIVGEQVTFALDVTTGNVSSGSNGTHTITATATSDTGSLATPQATPTIITVRRPELTVSKYVRNVSVPAMTGNAPTASDGTFTYYTSGITGVPGNELAYMIVVTNPANSGSATDVIIQDPIPLYTNYVAGTMQLDMGTGAFAAVTDNESDSDAGEYDDTPGSEGVWIYAGTGGTCGNSANTSGDGVGGTLSLDLTNDVVTRGIFHVRIQP